MTTRRTLLHRGLGFAACACLASPAAPSRAAGGKYVCPPCGCAMDGREFDAPGECPACGMRLTPKLDIPFEPERLSEGAGAFATHGGRGREHQRIEVRYFRPRRFSPQSPILIVLPGSGRGAQEYCDAWREASEAHGILVAALGYAEADYDFAAYHMGGVIKNLRMRNAPEAANGGGPTIVRLRDEDITFDHNPDRAGWLFHDFDRIFGLLVRASGSQRTGYDLFGHSAGGQILHRLVLFHPASRAERIVAANAGFYTAPDFATPLPFGLKDSGVAPQALAPALARELVLLIGEDDDGDHAGGIQLRTPLADRQGVGRLARARYFLAAGKARAAEMRVPFNWRLQVVPGVGHDYRGMSRAAARLLYA